MQGSASRLRSEEGKAVQSALGRLLGIAEINNGLTFWPEYFVDVRRYPARTCSRRPLQFQNFASHGRRDWRGERGKGSPWLRQLMRKQALAVFFPMHMLERPDNVPNKRLRARPATRGA